MTVTSCTTGIVSRTANTCEPTRPYPGDVHCSGCRGSGGNPGEEVGSEEWLWEFALMKSEMIKRPLFLRIFFGFSSIMAIGSQWGRFRCFRCMMRKPPVEAAHAHQTHKERTAERQKLGI